PFAGGVRRALVLLSQDRRRGIPAPPGTPLPRTRGGTAHGPPRDKVPGPLPELSTAAPARAPVVRRRPVPDAGHLPLPAHRGADRRVDRAGALGGSDDP